MNFIKKYELAFRYFPDAPSKKAATDNLTRAINRCEPLLMAMAKTGYRVTEKYYTPQQVEIITHYLGDP